MTIDLDFLLFLIAFLTFIGGSYGVIFRYVLKNDKTLVKLATSFEAFAERDRCEMVRLNKKVEDIEDELKDHEGRIGRLEAKFEE